MSTPRTQRSDNRGDNSVLIQCRQGRGWGRGRLALEFERIGREMGLPVPDRSSLEKAIYRHEKGLSRVTDSLYTKLYCAVYKASSHELFGGMPRIEQMQDQFSLDSHKFIPAYVGPHMAVQLGEDLGATTVDTEWSTCWQATIDHPHGECTLYGFPWGSLVYHLVETRTGSHVADLAIWRRHSYRSELAWMRQNLAQMLPEASGRPEYVLSAFWMTSPKWEGAQLETAMRLLCTPRTLLDRVIDEHTFERARLLEQTFLREGYDDQKIVDFGTYGVSIGFASWAGVSYHPFTARGALDASALVNLQLTVQGLWCYCQSLRSEVEAGRDPKVVGEYGWRWLRGIRSKLTSARPQELAQAWSMRVAILQTSELEAHLTSALEILRDVEQEGI